MPLKPVCPCTPISETGDFVAETGDFVAVSGDLLPETATLSPETGEFVAVSGDYIAPATKSQVSETGVDRLLQCTALHKTVYCRHYESWRMF